MKDGYVLLCPNAHRDHGLASTLAIAEALRKHGHEVRISPFLSDGLENTWPRDIPTAALPMALPARGSSSPSAATVRFCSFPGISPVPAFRSSVSISATRAFSPNWSRQRRTAYWKWPDGHYTVQTRMMLDLKLFRKGELVYEGSALNEAVVRASVSVVKLEAFSDGREVTAFSGDGMIASTPTGSTAYSMAAGGPIVEPCADCIILTPICTFRLAARSYVLKADREVSIRTVEQGDKEVFLSVDGVAVPFLDGDELVVARSDKTLLMARVKDRSFFDIVFEKLVDK